MVLTVYTLEQSEQWDNIVRSFKHYDTYWLSGYVKTFQIHGDGDPLLFFYDSDGTRGINVVMKRDVAKDVRFSGKIETGKYFDFSTPYGYGGWLIEGENIESLFLAYKEWINENEIISEFVRFHPLIKNQEQVGGFYEVVQLGKVVHMNLDTPDEIWKNLISKNRNMIRKAKKKGVEIHHSRTPEIYEQFRRIYNATMDKDAADKYYYFSTDFYHSICTDLSQNAIVFYAEIDGRIIAVAIMLMANGYMNYHLSGSKREYNSFAPSNLLLYEAAMWGCENGCRSLYLGGGVGSGEDSLFKFKRAFYRGDLNHFFIGKKIFDQKKYDELVNKRDNCNNNGYFPLYRS